MDFYFDRKGRPISRDEADALLSSIGKRRVAKDVIGDTLVSTVHLVIPHICCRADCPKGGNFCALFETMVRGPDQDDEIIRYHTMKEAIDGHAAIVKKLEAEV